MTGEHYFCETCGSLIEGADYDHSPHCPGFPVSVPGDDIFAPAWERWAEKYKFVSSYEFEIAETFFRLGRESGLEDARGSNPAEVTTTG